MKTGSPLSLLAIIGIAAILMMPAQFAQSSDPGSDITLTGTEGQDTFFGGHGNQQIFGFGSRDTLDGGEGDDMILGGPAADVIRGGPGRDLLYGGGASDKIDGGDGNDAIHGGGQGDNLNGGSGDDTIDGGFQSDLIFGGPGNDHLSGGPHSDNIFGDEDSDTIFGGPKNDNIFAGPSVVTDNIWTGTVTCASVQDGDIFAMNGLSYTAGAVTDPDTGEFSIVGNDEDCAIKLAESITLDTRDPVRFQTVELDLDLTATNDGAVVIITAHLSGVNLASTTPIRLAISGPFLTTTPDDQLFGGFGNDHLIGSLVGVALLDGGEDDDDFDGFYNEDPFDLVNNDAGTGDEFIDEDGPGNDNDVCFWDGGPARIIGDPDGIPGTGDEVYGDDILAVDDFGDFTCEKIHVLGIDAITLGGAKKGGGGKGNPPGLLSVNFVETVAPEPGDIAGLLTLTFNTDVDTRDSDQADRLADIFVSNFGVELMPLAGASFSPSNSERTVTFTLDHGQAFLILGLHLGIDTSPLLSLHANVLTDKFGNGNESALVGITVDAIDEIEPQLIGSAYVPGSGLLKVAFDEKVDPLSVIEGSFSVRPAGASTGGVTLSGTTSIVSVGNTIEITVSDAQRVAINDLINLPAATAPNPIELDVLAGAVADIAATPNFVLETNDTSIFVQSDTTPPLIPSATFDESFNLLTISFTENVDVTPVTQVDLSGIFVTEDGTFDANVLTGATVNNLVDGNPISITVTDAQKAGIIALISPVLDVSAGSFVDLSGNPGPLQSVPIALTPTDITPPSITNVEFDESFGFLRITFDEEVDLTPDTQVDLSKVFISETGNTNETPLTGATHVTSSDNDILELELTATQISTLTGLTSPQLDVQADAFQDPKGNLILATADHDIDMGTQTDITKPVINTVDYNSITGILTITFDDIIDVSASDLSKVFVSKDKKRNQIQLSGAFFTSGDSDVVTIDVSAHQAEINALPSHQLDVGKNAFTDDAGNRSDKQDNIPINVT